MRLSEVKKSYDGTLVKIRENLIDTVAKNKLGKRNQRLKGRVWIDHDVVKSNEMVKKINQTLKRREQLKRLKEYVGGRPKTVNPHTFVRPMSVIAWHWVASKCITLINAIPALSLTKEPPEEGNLVRLLIKSLTRGEAETQFCLPISIDTEQFIQWILDYELPNDLVMTKNVGTYKGMGDP
ncbi:hypothetical protein Tco_0992784 [Tanacetum coccineum]|uniref:Reverse transcriptase n=1 Tax=Tanacetum coccineum TaxID=301880 RepID=A0ABQ5F3A9_9ASTR